MIPPKCKKLLASLLATSCLTSPVLASAPALDTPDLTKAIPVKVWNVNHKAVEQCGPINGGAQNPEVAKRIADFMTLLHKSATAHDLLVAATYYDGTRPAWICFQDMDVNTARYHVDAGTISLNKVKSDEELVIDTVHELRHLYQEKVGLFALPTRDHQERTHVTYAGEADAEAVTILALWELKEAGYPAPWEKHTNYDNYDSRSICYAHISNSFRIAVANNVPPQEAIRFAFRAWYSDTDLLSHYQSHAQADMSRQELTQAEVPSPKAQPVPKDISNCYNVINRAPRFENLPSDKLSRDISNRIGNLPHYNVNFVQQGGGLKRILQGP